jgi:hypothetical protein
LEFIGCLVPLFVGFLIIRAIWTAIAGPGGGLLKNGVPARGILLQVSWMATRVQGSTTQPMERREVLIDVEVPGRPPYEVRAQALVPINLRNDVMPGATVELRVDPKDPKNLAIVGPGSGFAVTGLVTTPQPGPNR